MDALAADWARALRGQGLSAEDLDELWAGLTEEAVRRGAASVTARRFPAPAWRAETREVLARVRHKVEAALGER